MRLSETLLAAADRLIPADDWPAARAGGLDDYLAASADLASAEPMLSALDAHLGAGFAALAPADQDALLAAAEADPDAAEAFEALRRVVMEGFYAPTAGHSPAGPAMIGFAAVPPGVTPIEPDPVPSIPSGRVAPSYDAIVIGSGPGGGVAAETLAKAGKRVLLVERQRPQRNADLRGDHLHGKRNQVYRVTAGPGPGHPRVLRPEGGADITTDGSGGGGLYGLNAMTLGGGTRVWQGMSWRFLPEDFRMRTVYGEPDGASLPDWPVDYAEMEPYYTRAEQELGVAGDEGGLTARTPRSAGYPMPAMGTEPARKALGAAADRLGWGWGPIPLAINSEPRDGRAACVRCPQCVGHACPVDAENGSHTTFVPRAVATGNVDLLLDAEVVEVTDGERGARVRIMADASTDPVELTVTADVAVVSAGAVETPRLLLASGLGNANLGRFLHDHRYITMLGRTAEPLKPWRGPGHSVATLEHVHAASIPWGGGVLVDLMSLLPITWAMTPEPGVPTWGAEHKAWLRDGRRFAFGVFGMGQEIPSAASGVTLSSTVRDRWGAPAAVMTKVTHPASLEVEAGMAEQGGAWLGALGAEGIRRQVGTATASAAGEHSCGTARMADSPADGATDRFGRLHGTRRVVVCDISLHPTNGSVNPALTVVANAMRIAEHLVADWPDGRVR